MCERERESRSGRSQPLDCVVCERERVGLVEVSGWMVLCV